MKQKVKEKFNYGNIHSLMENSIGVYGFWILVYSTKSWKCIYIGKTKKCLKTRLKQHYDLEEPAGVRLRQYKRAHGDAFYFCYYLVADQKVSAMEKALIRKWRPVGNTITYNR